MRKTSVANESFIVLEQIGSQGRHYDLVEECQKCKTRYSYEHSYVFE